MAADNHLSKWSNHILSWETHHFDIDKTHVQVSYFKLYHYNQCEHFQKHSCLQFCLDSGQAHAWGVSAITVVSFPQRLEVAVALVSVHGTNGIAIHY